MRNFFSMLFIGSLAIFNIGCDEILEDISGCMLVDAPNYKPSAIQPCSNDCINDQQGSNCCCEEIIYGCMDTEAPNYSDTANSPCVEEVAGVETPNACCVESITGCMD